MILTLSEAAELKKETAEKCSVRLHFHDGCGGQYFSLDQPDEAAAQHIAEFLALRNRRALFSEDGLRFTVEKATRTE